MIGEEPVDHPLKAVQLLQKKFGRKMKPVEVPAEQAVSGENIVEGDNIDIRRGRGPLNDDVGLKAAHAVALALRAGNPISARVACSTSA